MKIDLHNHTLHSDGVLTSEELLKRAINNKVDVFALTDHDSVFGCDEIEQLSKGTKVRIIKGLELSTYYKGESVHIICLFKNNKIPKEMLDFSNELLEKRRKRAIDMMNNIHNIYGLKVDIKRLLDESQIITRANMLRNVAEENNMSYKDAQFYISNESKAYIPSTKLSVEDGLKLAREANCFCIFAHPCLIKKQELVEEILKFGFDGIEVRYPSKKNSEKHFKKLAKKYNLLISAGSDCHGDSTHSDIGTCALNENEFKPIADILGFNL